MGLEDRGGRRRRCLGVFFAGGQPDAGIHARRLGLIRVQAGGLFLALRRSQHTLEGGHGCLGLGHLAATKRGGAVDAVEGLGPGGHGLAPLLLGLGCRARQLVGVPGRRLLGRAHVGVIGRDSLIASMPGRDQIALQLSDPLDHELVGLRSRVRLLAAGVDRHASLGAPVGTRTSGHLLWRAHRPNIGAAALRVNGQKVRPPIACGHRLATAKS